MKKISKERFITLLNEEMQKHPAYKKGYNVCYDGSGYWCVDELGNRVTGDVAFANTDNRLREEYKIIYISE